MIFEGEEQTNSGVENESSPETQASSAESKAPESAQAAPESSEKQTTDSENVPFHQHPRFKELVEQKNGYADKYKSLEQKYAEMEARFQQMEAAKAKKEEDALISRLKGIDPEFGERFEKLDATQRELQELRQWKDQLQAEQTRSQALGMIKDLHTQNKVPTELQERYNREIEYAAMRNPKLSLQDLPNLYKQVHEDYTKLLESARRAERESYVKAKSADAKLPTSQPKGKPVNSAQGSDYSKDPMEARQQLIRRVLKQAKASDSL